MSTSKDNSLVAIATALTERMQAVLRGEAELTQREKEELAILGFVLDGLADHGDLA